MYNDVFKSLHESVKRRNTPDSFLPLEEKSEKPTIHRGYLKTGAVPIRYDFIPDGKQYANSGSHVYSFRDKNNSGSVSISHTHSQLMSGHETRSVFTFEPSGKEPAEDIDIHRMLIPIMQHHMKSHGPDILTFTNTVKFSDDLIKRLGPTFEMSKKSTKNGRVTIAKRIIDPKITRVISQIKKTLNKKKEK